MEHTILATITQETRIDLSRRESLALGRLRGHVIECRSGQVWLTADGEGRDVVLEAGQQWLVEPDTPVVVTAFKPSVLHLRAPNRRRAFPPTVASRLRRCFPSPNFPSPSAR